VLDRGVRSRVRLALPLPGADAKYLADIAWEAEVWCADNPTHLIHFNGERFLGPVLTGPCALTEWLRLLVGARA
jgi:hypothetical protein